MRHLIEINDCTMEDFTALIELAKDIQKNPAKYANSMRGRLLATLFYEPSTRTRFSFEAAMLRLGGQVIGFSEAQNSSVSKGESLKDTIRTVACYSDIAVMRHYMAGAPKIAASVCDIPLINAGDGGNQHPTQTLTDLLTISSEKNTLQNLTVVLCGDLLHGRTVHSLVQALKRFPGNRFIFVSPKELSLPQELKAELAPGSYQEARSLEEALPHADVLYMTRIQRERFEEIEAYERLKNCFVLNAAKMRLAKDDMIVLHPLPRVQEISEEVDQDSRAKYFAQAKYGMFVRMALVHRLVSQNQQQQEAPFVDLTSLPPVENICNAI